MKIQKVLFLTAGLLIGSVSAGAAVKGDSAYVQDDYVNIIQPVTPVYLDDVAGNLSFTSNWFLSFQGGVSAFIGKPVGCGDLFDRTKPMLSIGLGKWFTPHFGSRLSFQGFKFVDQSLASRTFQSVHLDLMYNLCNGYRCRLRYHQQLVCTEESFRHLIWHHRSVPFWKEDDSIWRAGKHLDLSGL